MTFLFKSLFVLIFISVNFFTNFQLQASETNFLPIKREKWGAYDVVWIEDDRFPTYNFSLYFADGALSDKYPGESEYTFSMLDSGTNRFTQKEIHDALEFYGVTYGATVTHEYVLFTVSGLVKDIVPTMKMICHLYSGANFPKDELNKTKARERSSLLNMGSDHSSLVDRVFREVSLKGTPYDLPTSGTLKSLKKITSSALQNKLDYYKNNVKKKIYLTGPKDLSKVKDIFLSECGMNAKANFVRENPQQEKKKSITKENLDKVKIYFVPVAKANQTQIRIGRFIPDSEVAQQDLALVAAGFLGGGFTSKFMQEARVKRGLTYGIGSLVSFQRYYGREFIRTSTRNNSTGEMLKVIKNILDETGAGKITDEEWAASLGHLSGSYLFKFEDNDAYLSNIVYFDHVGRNVSELYNFPQIIKTYNPQLVSQKINEIFDWPKQVIMILGAPTIKKDLKTFGQVIELDYHKFL